MSKHAQGHFSELASASAGNAYRKIRKVGQGAFGKAYLVESLRDPVGERFVLKKMPLSRKDSSELAKKEAHLLRRISRGCPFIVAFQDVFIDPRGHHLSLIMEWASGGDLRNAIDSRDGRRMSEPESLELIAQVCMALRHCHALGAIHRDVKPDNCFLKEPNGRLLLGDFGISAVLDERTHAETVVGTPFYLSPEIMKGEPYAHTSDMWSLGVMLYECATLRKPFPGSNICALAMQIVAGEPEPLAEAEFSSPFRVLVGRLLEKDRSLRVTAAQALEVPCLAAAAHGVFERFSLPPLAPPDPSCIEARRVGGGGGLVARMRNKVEAGLTGPHANSPARGTEDEYPDDFEAEYDDDFEAASDEEIVAEEYEPDFEDFSDEEAATPSASVGLVNEQRCTGPTAGDPEMVQQIEVLRKRVAHNGEVGSDLKDVLDFLDGVIAQGTTPAKSHGH